MFYYAKKKVAIDSRFHKAFTLVELLVVIFIIALLLAVFVPALNSSRKAGKTALCASRMKQISLAMRAYAMNFDDRIIMGREMIFADHASKAVQVWHIALMPYIAKKINEKWLENHAELWLCPEDKDPYPKGFYNCPHDPMTSYAINGFSSETEPAFARPAVSLRLGPGGGYRFNQLKNTGEMMLMAETSYAAQLYDVENPATAGIIKRYDGHHRMTSGFYHRAAMNILYADGHIQTVKGLPAPADPKYIPSNYLSGQYAFWKTLRLASSVERPEFWGPGY